jgi:superfamily II DNA/RNA helicase
MGAMCRTCHVAVGTPGRLCALIGDGNLPVDRVKLLVLDEADRLMAHPFDDDVEWILGVLPAKKQVEALCGCGCCVCVCL